MRRDLQPVAGTERARLRFVLEAQPGRTGQQQNPLRLILVVPEAVRACLAERDDALDAQAGAGDKCIGDFGRTGIRQVPQQVHGPAIDSTPSTARRQPA